MYFKWKAVTGPSRAVIASEREREQGKVAEIEEKEAPLTACTVRGGESGLGSEQVDTGRISVETQHLRLVKGRRSEVRMTSGWHRMTQ